jgi:tetratricopeptide (TPR) repeat protein
MPTTKKKAGASATEPVTELQPLTRTAPVKPRNIAAYEAAVAEFATASTLFGKGEFAEAKIHFDAVAAAASAEEPILADRARTYASICGKKTAAPDAGGSDAESYYHRGVVAVNAGRLDDAWAFLEKAVALRPGDASILYARASVRGLQGNVEGAASELKRALAIDPTFRYQAVSDSDFDGVRDEAAFIDVIEPSHAGA